MKQTDGSLIAGKPEGPAAVPRAERLRGDGLHQEREEADQVRATQAVLPVNR